MRFSGTGGAGVIDLKQPNTANIEESEAGSGTLGPFTLRIISAETTPPQPSSTCSGPYSTRVAGAGVFRFQDGSLLKVKLTEGHDCIDFVALEAHCTRTFEITGGTRRFKDASSGILTLTETVVPVLFDAAGNPAFFAATGEFTGTVSGVAAEEEHQDDRQ
jgi:hypothetical protein